MRNPSHHHYVAFTAAWLVVILLFATVMVAQPLDRRAALAGGIFRASVWGFLACVAAWLGCAFMRAFQYRLPRFTYNVLTVASALMFLGIYAGGASNTRLELKSQQQIRFGHDIVQIHGAIAPTLADDLRRLMHPTLRPTRVELTSPGGSVAAALNTADLLIDHGVQRAVIQGDCNSACAIMALALPERYLAPGAGLGFHELSALGTSRTDLAEEREMLLLRFSHQGLPTETLRPLFQGRDMQYPTRAWLLQHNLITGCWDDQKETPVECIDGGSLSRLTH